jgi:hypothetical protein
VIVIPCASRIRGIEPYQRGVRSIIPEELSHDVGKVHLRKVIALYTDIVNVVHIIQLIMNGE